MEFKLEPIAVNYKNIKFYKTAKLPRRQNLFWMLLITGLSKFMLIGKKYKITKINMEGLKGPYFMISNHMQFIDFELAAIATFPRRVHNVVSIDGFYKRPWLLEAIGCIATRKFTNDLHLVKSINHVLKRDVIGLYPEARYSPAGISSFIPESLGKLVKMNKVPLVVILHRGNYLYTPFWNFRSKRKVPFHTTIKQVLTKEDIQNLSVEEINEVIRKEMTYDEYQYQRENNILIKQKDRAEGLHRILYQCPHCHTESKMNSKGTKIFCEECGKEWEFEENGSLRAIDGNTKFDNVPDWFRWEREEVKKQIYSGNYHFMDDVEVYSLPNVNKYTNLGKAKVSHDPENGFIIEGFYNEKTYRIIRHPIQSNSLHVEYDYFRIKRDDCFILGTENDNFFCYPSKPNVITKLAFATEIIYQKKYEELQKNKL